MLLPDVHQSWRGHFLFERFPRGAFECLEGPGAVRLAAAGVEGWGSPGSEAVSYTHLADRVVVLDGGRVRLDGTPEEVLTQGELLESLNLDMPFACRLSLQLQRRGVPVEACVTDAELKEELCRLFSTR